MNRRSIAVLSAALALAGTVAGQAGAAAAQPGELPASGARVRDVDPLGTPLSSWRAVGAARPDRADVAAVADGRAPENAGKGRRRLQAAAYCREVDAWRNGRTVLGFIAYRYHLVKRWCYDGARIWSPSARTYISDVDPTMYWRGEVNAASSYYAWCCGSPSSGHWSFRQGQFENCVLRYGCIRTEYPWVKVWGHADGGFSYDTGT